MDTLLQFIPIAIIVLLVAVVVVLFMGVGGMAVGGRVTPAVRNKLMRIRVILQGLIIVLVLITFAAAAFR